MDESAIAQINLNLIPTRTVTHFHSALREAGCLYRVRQVVVTWVELILIRDVPLPVSFCLGSWMLGRMGWLAWQE